MRAAVFVSLLMVGCGGDNTTAKADMAQAPATRWFTTCGDPVCRGHTVSGVSSCMTEKEGDPCDTANARCDPNDSCNALLVCAVSDPKTAGCPISRKKYKTDVRYLDEAEISRLHDELMRFRLARWRYQDAPDAEHLGFMIDDVEPSDAAHSDRVDLYGYTSMAVAALKVQQQRIDALEKELARLHKTLRKRP